MDAGERREKWSVTPAKRPASIASVAMALLSCQVSSRTCMCCLSLYVSMSPCLSVNVFGQVSGRNMGKVPWARQVLLHTRLQCIVPSFIE